jgi:hypothetical protein
VDARLVSQRTPEGGRWIKEQGRLRALQGRRRVGRYVPSAAQIETVTQALRELDNLHGGGLAREALIGHLSWAASLLEDAAYTDYVGLPANGSCCPVSGGAALFREVLARPHDRQDLRCIFALCD